MSTIVDTASAGSLEQPCRIGAATPNRNVERQLTGPIGATSWRLTAPNIARFLISSGVTVAKISGCRKKAA